MKRRNLRRGFAFQRYEDRRLLAADVPVELAPVENLEPETCQVTGLQSEDDVQTLEVLADEAVVEDIDTVSKITDLGDPADGTDGYFGSINAESPSQQFSLTPSEAGIVDVVVGSSFGDHETRLEVFDSSGDLVASTMTEDLSGFQMLSFEADSGESYQLNVSSEDGAEGYFQVTIGHSEIPEPTDLHADETGETSTELEFVDGSSEMFGDLELAGDVDTFRFTADANGKMSLGLAELDAENATELQVQVTNADGELLTRGITNETVGISFDVECDAEYFVAVSAGEDQSGSYRVDMTMEADIEEPADEIDDSIATEEPEDQNNEPATLEFIDGVAVVSGELNSYEESEQIQFVAPTSGEIDLDLNIQSEGNLADASVDIFDASGNQIVSGATNDDVGILFNVAEGEAMQLQIESMNDLPATYELTATLTTAETEDEADPIDDLIDETADQPLNSELVDDNVSTAGTADELISDDADVCYADMDFERDAVDSFFAEFDPDSIFIAERGLGVRRG